jgi:fermentation-respiration switch protein FrsA (DUF1100 family)
MGTTVRLIRAGKGWVRSVAVRLVVYPLLMYLTAGSFFYTQQSKLLFPAPKNSGNAVLPKRGRRFEDLRIKVNATDHLHAFWISDVTASGKVGLVFHGNGYALEDMLGDEATDLQKIGANLLLIDYRGYGASTPISPSEATINEDADAAIAYLLRDRQVPVGNVFVLGRSIGSGPATYLASKTPGLCGLILESPFSSIEDAASGIWYFRIYPTRLMLRTHFDNLSRIRSVRSPLLITAGEEDTLTPVWMAKKIFAEARQPKQLYLVPKAGHNDLLAIGGDGLTQALRRFVYQKP